MTEVQGVGKRGAIVEVSEGYARNFLIPSGSATIATAARIAHIEHENVTRQKKVELHDQELGELVKRLSHARVTVVAAANDKGTLFGSVTEPMLRKVLAQQGLHVPEHSIVMTPPIDHLGNHTLSINLSSAHTASITVTVVADKNHHG